MSLSLGLSGPEMNSLSNKAKNRFKKKNTWQAKHTICKKKTLTYKNKGTRTIKDLSNKKPAHEGVKGRKHEQKAVT